MTPTPELEAAVERWLRKKYVQRADDRQRAMGLDYTTAETKDLAREIARFLASLPTGAGEGEWLLVPVEPTEAMLNAARENDAELREQGFNGAEVEGVWATMLALSPSPDTVVVGREREIAERTLDAAASYLTEQYGAPYGLSHPVDRERILALSSLPVEGGE